MDIHTWFNLSYASYFVMPRSVLQAMPEDWQHRFTALVNECNDTLDWGEDKRYTVLCRAETGRFVPDPLRHYRHAPPIPHKVAIQGTA